MTPWTDLAMYHTALPVGRPSSGFPHVIPRRFSIACCLRGLPCDHGPIRPGLGFRMICISEPDGYHWHPPRRFPPPETEHIPANPQHTCADVQEIRGASSRNRSYPTMVLMETLAEPQPILASPQDKRWANRGVVRHSAAFQLLRVCLGHGYRLAQRAWNRAVVHELGGPKWPDYSQTGQQAAGEDYTEAYQQPYQQGSVAPASSSNTQRTPRSHSRRPTHTSEAIPRNRRQSFSTNTTRGQRQTVPSRRERRDRVYHESRGYNEPRGGRSRDRAVEAGDYEDPNLPRQDPTTESQGETVYEEVSTASGTDIATGMAQMTMGPPDFSSSPNYVTSPSQEYTSVVPGPVMRPSAGTTNRYSAVPTQSRGYTVNVVQNAGVAAAAGAEENPFAERRIDSTPGSYESLDNSFQKRNRDWKTFFKCGRVFKTLWTDPYNESARDASDHSQFKSEVVFQVALGQYVYSKVRRFVVVSLRDRSCQCLPITTYDGKGYEKRGIRLNEHGLIYIGDRRPTNVRGITKIPLRLRPPGQGGERLNKTSYINYGRTYSVDCHVKVKDLGILDSESRSLLRQYFNQTILATDDDQSGPILRRNPQMQDTLMGVGAGVADYSEEAETRTERRRPDSYYAGGDDAGPSTQFDPAATEYNEHYADQEQYYSEDEVTSQPTPEDAGVASYEGYHIDEHQDDNVPEQLPGPSSDVGYFPPVDDTSQPLSGPIAPEDEDIILPGNVAQPQSPTGSGERRRRRRGDREREPERDREQDRNRDRNRNRRRN